jgi:hypothetical protein
MLPQHVEAMQQCGHGVSKEPTDMGGYSYALSQDSGQIHVTCQFLIDIFSFFKHAINLPTTSIMVFLQRWSKVFGCAGVTR